MPLHILKSSTAFSSLASQFRGVQCFKASATVTSCDFLSQSVRVTVGHETLTPISLSQP